MQGRLENLLAALATSLSDQIHVATEDAAEHGASAPAALAAILRRPGQSIGELRARLELSHSATVRLVDRLAEDGLVVRRPGVDGREVAVALTVKGRRRALRVLQARRSTASRALAGLAANERRELEVLADRLLRNQSAQRDDPRPVCRLCEVPACPLRRCPVPGGR
jgi:MarR family transcriptional regulator, negative regulator of the multidrug operon emrRAB